MVGGQICLQNCLCNTFFWNDILGFILLLLSFLHLGCKFDLFLDITGASNPIVSSDKENERKNSPHRVQPSDLDGEATIKAALPYWP